MNIFNYQVIEIESFRWVGKSVVSWSIMRVVGGLNKTPLKVGEN